MASIAANPAPDTLKGPLSISLVMHGVLALLFVGSAVFSHQGDSWGGPGGAITVGVVGSLPAVPMPRPEVETLQVSSGRPSGSSSNRQGGLRTSRRRFGCP